MPKARPWPNLAVAMATAVYNEQETKRCFVAGACDFIPKPINCKYLKTALLVKLF